VYLTKTASSGYSDFRFADSVVVGAVPNSFNMLDEVAEVWNGSKDLIMYGNKYQMFTTILYISIL
jgi:hypothetical protein